MGILPLDYLNNSEQYLAENLFMNSQQILVQYDVKELFRKETSLWFRPFSSLAGIILLVYTVGGCYFLSANMKGGPNKTKRG